MAARVTVATVAACMGLLACGRTPLETDGSAIGNGAGARAQAEAGTDPAGQGGVSGAQGSGAQGSGAAASAGAAQREVETCSAREDEARWGGGARLYVGQAASCGERTPCFPSLQAAIDGAATGDTVVVLPGMYSGALIYQGKELGSLRITAEDRAATTIQGTLRVTGEDETGGQIWIDHLTFRDSGPSSSSVEDGWGVYVTSWAAVDVRVQDSVFVEHSGRGGIALWSSTVRTRFNAVIARNQFFDNSGEEAALDIDLPADAGEDYCVRVENNLIADNRVGLSIFYTPFGPTPGRFEFVNNTITGNERGIGLSVPAGSYVFLNNVIFGNDRDLPETAELGGPFQFRHNLIGSGQFTGLHGNFAADPLFVDAAARDFRLRSGSPAAARGELAGAPLSDLDGTARGELPDLGAHEWLESTGERLEGLSCGDGVVQRGPIPTAAGDYLGFETCDDGNTVGGDGCSAFCQFEPSGPLGLISRTGASLCVIREDGSLSCWNDAAINVPAGTFRQVAVSAYHACGLQSDGSIACWTEHAGDTIYTPPGVFEQIAGDYEQTCGVREGGSVHCWDEDGETLHRDGAFVRVATDYRVCALTGAGAMSCWDPYDSFPTGPFLQVLPDRYGGCALKESGELVCLTDAGIASLERVLPAALLRVHTDGSDASGVRPDGRAVRWGSYGAVSLPAQDREFIEVVAGFVGGCGLTRDHKAYCWGDSYGLPEE